MKYVKSLMQKAHRGQGGFTLIELLVVVAILGVIAAVVVLNVGGFLGRGTEESANTEAHQVQTAVIAYMTEENLSTWAGTVGPTSGTGTPGDYLLNAARLQATYTVADGKLTDADFTGVTDSKWGTCAFADGAWTC